jgi:hypothetical protein
MKTWIGTYFCKVNDELVVKMKYSKLTSQIK